MASILKKWKDDRNYSLQEFEKRIKSHGEIFIKILKKFVENKLKLYLEKIKDTSDI